MIEHCRNSCGASPGNASFHISPRTSRTARRRTFPTARKCSVGSTVRTLPARPAWRADEAEGQAHRCRREVTTSGAEGHGSNTPRGDSGAHGLLHEPDSEWLPSWTTPCHPPRKGEDRSRHPVLWRACAYAAAVVSSELSLAEPMAPLPNELVEAPIIDAVLPAEVGD